METVIIKIMNDCYLPKWNKWILVSLVCYSKSFEDENKQFVLNETLFRHTYNIRPQVFINGIKELKRKNLIKYDYQTSTIYLKFLEQYN